ncbi:hypothetical protein P5637_21220 [Bacillus paralicheniformis]|uniref:hypothetical protein n=1 Tax=Bacillus paralicheniformis TaxID=1648923 RepID=UPI0011A72D15|nr:hypothetical protein [Bacillus paralicheniformis]MBZ5216177.1 hypothetical protein [Bacillus paralicheniformis]WEZ23845.1 hypothetical protein P5637_21220 [Bacillus paralicheniformis]
MDSIIAIPMYRVSPGKWEKEFEEILDKKYQGFDATEEQIEKYKERARRTEYYHWKYNDVVAWIELYLDFSVVKARAYIADKKVFRRGFHPIYKDNSKIGFEVRIYKDKDNNEIVSDIISGIESWRKHYHKSRWIDYSFLSSISWIDLVK